MYTSSNGGKTDQWWTGEDVKGNGRGLNHVPYQNLSGGTEESQEIPVSQPAEIRTKHLSNRNQERYRYANPLRDRYHDGYDSSL